MEYNFNDPIGNINKTENPLYPYKYPTSCVRYLTRAEFLKWSKGKELS